MEETEEQERNERSRKNRRKHSFSSSIILNFHIFKIAKCEYILYIAFISSHLARLSFLLLIYLFSARYNFLIISQILCLFPFLFIFGIERVLLLFLSLSPSLVVLLIH